MIVGEIRTRSVVSCILGAPYAGGVSDMPPPCWCCCRDGRGEVGHKPVGIVTDRNIVVAILAAQGDPEVLTMDNIWSRPLITVTDMAGILEAMQLTCQHGIKRLPIVNADGILVGIVTPIIWWR